MKKDFENYPPIFSFEDYLGWVHARNYMGTDDDMKDNFESWLEDLCGQEYLDYGDDYAQYVKWETKEDIKNLILKNQ